jgi:hypothetical protein
LVVGQELAIGGHLLVAGLKSFFDGRVEHERWRFIRQLRRGCMSLARQPAPRG